MVPHHSLVIPGGVPLMAIVNIAHVQFPAVSVTMSSYMPLVDRVVQLLRDAPLSVAVTPGEVSEKVMVTGVV